jgi:hypothetical protein
MRQEPACWSRPNGPHLLIWPDGEPLPTCACLPSAACPRPRPRPVRDTFPGPQGVKAKASVPPPSTNPTCTALTPCGRLADPAPGGWGTKGFSSICFLPLMIVRTFCAFCTGLLSPPTKYTTLKSVVPLPPEAKGGITFKGLLPSSQFPLSFVTGRTQIAILCFRLG